LFALNERKGWTVLIAVTAVCLAVAVMLLWFAASLIFRWRFQFSVRSLVVLVIATAIACCWLTVKMRQAERQRQVAEAIRQAGGAVYYDYEFDKRGIPSGGEPTAPAWLRRLVGEDFFSQFVHVYLSNTGYGDEGLEHLKAKTNLVVLGLSNTQITDAGLENLKRLTNLKWLDLLGTQVTDNGLERLKGQTNLESLYLLGTQITDNGLEHLKGLTNLRYLDLSNTQVTKKGVEELDKALPNCRVVHWSS